MSHYTSRRTSCAGHGLGLAVSKETVEGLGGSLELESEEGVGTRATLRLPAMEQPHSE